MQPLSDEPDELLDLVDENDVVLGTVTREEVARQMMHLPGFVRAANLFIINNRGELWVPRRSPHKKTAPNGLDYSAGEHVHAGETYVVAMLRGMQEELNLTAQESQLEYIGKINNAPVGIPYFNALFIYRTDDVPPFNTEDFVSWEWLKPQDLLAKLEAGEAAKRDLRIAVNEFVKRDKV